MKSIALIPARGGSKRLPRKNILPFLGKPTVAYSIEAALESGLFERVIVSTEDKEIADIAAKHGAEISLRSDELAADKATVDSVALDFLRQEEESGRSYDIICVLYATAVMRTAEDIHATYNLLERGKCPFAMAVTTYDLAPHQALKKTSEKGDLAPMWPDIVELRADALPKLVVGNGSTYCAYIDDYKENKSFYHESMRGHIMPRWKSVDIDTAEDFELAEIYAEKYKKDLNR